MASEKSAKKSTTGANAVVEKPEETKTTADKVATDVAAVVNHVMFTESDIATVLTLLSSMSVTGADNILKFSDAYKILSHNGAVVPVTIS